MIGEIGNGVGTLDQVIASVVRPRRLIAVNVVQWQLAAGWDRLAGAIADSVLSGAVRLPIVASRSDGIVSEEAVFHFLDAGGRCSRSVVEYLG